MGDDALLHFTGRATLADQAAEFSVLESICTKNELWFSRTAVFGDEKWERKVDMCCLTELELSKCQGHSERFGPFAVAFKRRKLQEYGAKSVSYVKQEDYLKIQLRFLDFQEKIDLEKDKEWRKQGEPESYDYTESQFLDLKESVEWLQEHAYKPLEKNDPNFVQREWRIVFDFLECSLVDTPLRPGMTTCDYNACRPFTRLMKFAPDDIEFIVVPRSYEDQGRKLADDIGKRCKILEDELGDD